MWKCWLTAKLVKVFLSMDYNATVATAVPGMEEDNMPMARITVRGGIVVRVVTMLDNTVCSLPDMRGWYVEEVVEWINDGTMDGQLNIIKMEV